MPAALYSHDRPRFAGSVIATLAHQPPRSSTPLSSYTSLDHALDPLDPPGARESNRSAHQPPPSLSPSSQMTSDGRYAYPPPPDAAPAYGYAPYPPPYAHGQYPPDASRPSGRPASSSGQPPPPQAPPPYHGPPGYPAHPPYPPPTYGVAPAPPGPWTGEGWTHYPHYPPPHPPGQEYPHSTNGSRPEPPAEDHRGYPPPPAREERPPRPAEAPTQSKVRNGKESEPPAPGPSRSPPLGMDYGKVRYFQLRPPARPRSLAAWAPTAVNRTVWHPARDCRLPHPSQQLPAPQHSAGDHGAHDAGRRLRYAVIRVCEPTYRTQRAPAAARGRASPRRGPE
ncbi:hypothetical protein C8Q72DRAFT_115361 [Fomitopsis betulina]|nr:hypothetical protein C8Q72DRAFT_115361 [Fomitopsis betulina]